MTLNKSFKILLGTSLSMNLQILWKSSFRFSGTRERFYQYEQLRTTSSIVWDMFACGGNECTDTDLEDISFRILVQ